MVLTPVALKPNQTHHFPPPISHPKPSFHFRRKTQMTLQIQSNPISRRRASSSIATTASLLLLATQEAIFGKETANAADAFDFFRMTVPDQTLEEAEGGIKGHALSLLQVKELLELESWKESQKALRKSSSLLKQDIYTIIQAKPGMQRPLLRELYSKLFNSVTGLDYAARDKDVTRVWECYGDIVVALNDILSRI